MNLNYNPRVREGIAPFGRVFRFWSVSQERITNYPAIFAPFCSIMC